jgi:hypothetical protein
MHATERSAGTCPGPDVDHIVALKRRIAEAKSRDRVE